MPWITYWFRPEIFFCCFLYPQSPNFSLRLSEFMLTSARFAAALKSFTNTYSDDVFPRMMSVLCTLALALAMRLVPSPTALPDQDAPLTTRTARHVRQPATPGTPCLAQDRGLRRPARHKVPSPMESSSRMILSEMLSWLNVITSAPAPVPSLS